MYFTIYSHNIPVKGGQKSLVYDLRKEALVAIPNGLYYLLERLRIFSVEEIRSGLSAADARVVEQYLGFLAEKDLGVFSERRAPFGALELRWHSPSLVSTAVLEYGFTGYPLAGVLDQLNGLLCKNLELRLYDVDREELASLLARIDRGVFSYLVVYVEGDAEMRETIERVSSKAGEVFVADGLREEASFHRYIVNMPYFSEAQEHHPYFNQRICVSRSGEIKRCLTHAETFGNVRDKTLREVIDDPVFTEWWDIAPDDIEDLKDSAFRYAIYTNKPLIKLGDNRYTYKN
jgi:hypothetical protein